MRGVARVGQPVDEFERRLVVLHRLLRRGDGHRVVAGADARVVRGRVVVRGARVPGELGGAAVGAGGDDRGVVGVQPDPLARQQILVHGLGEQRVPERVAAPARGDLQDVRVEGIAQRGVQACGGQVDDGGEDVVRDPSARDGGDADDQARVVGEPVEPHEQQVGELPGQLRARVVLGRRW